MFFNILVCAAINQSPIPQVCNLCEMRNSLTLFVLYVTCIEVVAKKAQKIWLAGQKLLIEN